MTYDVLTLIAPPGSGLLTQDIVGAVTDFLQIPEPPRWLAQLEACEFQIAAHPAAQTRGLEQNLRKKLQPFRIDLVIQPETNRIKKLLVADMDSTIICQECIDELADFVGLKDHIAEITEKAMHGEIAFEEALTERVRLLQGLSTDVFETVIEERISLMPGARTLVQTMRANGAFCALVSGGFSYFTSRIAAWAGFDVDHANTLEIADGKLTGQLKMPILGRHAKLKTLMKYREDLELTADETMAVGDGANDLEMIREAGLGAAFHAKPIVAREAQARIDFGDLTALLYIQGHRKEDFKL